MKAEIVNLTTLFSKHVSYRIPRFQRPYVWNEDKQWSPLWEDVTVVAGHCLNRHEHGGIGPHFMGAVVLQSQDNMTAEVEKKLVVDGQQRLTTFQLLLKVVQELCRNLGDQTRAGRLETYVINSDNFLNGDNDNKTKIRQANAHDQRAFQAMVLDGGHADMSETSAIYGAYQYFAQAVSSWLSDVPATQEESMQALEEALSKHMQFAVIDLTNEEQPNIIFEVLNDRGEPLKQADLVKNHVMYESQVADDDKKAREIWEPFDDNTWWNELTREGRLKRTHMDRFLHHWTMVLTGRFIASERVAAAVREHISVAKKNSPDAVAQIVADLQKSGRIYQGMEQGQYSQLNIFLARMKAINTSVFLPLLLYLFHTDMPESRRMSAVQALESYIVRRTLCGLSLTGLNRLFLEIMADIDQNKNHAVADEVVIEQLRQKVINNRLWPDDLMVKQALIEQQPMRNNVPRLKMVMIAVEMWLRSDMTEPLGNTDSLTLEHIMPQEWQPHWPLPSDTVDDADAAKRRDEAVRALGNLTLTTDKLNKTVSHGKWANKRQRLDRHSSLKINSELVKRNPVVWDEEAIAQRSQYLADIILEIWPAKENF